MTYRLCRKVIQNKAYKTTEEMELKLDVFLLNNRINQDEYNELIDLLGAD